MLRMMGRSQSWCEKALLMLLICYEYSDLFLDSLGGQVLLANSNAQSCLSEPELCSVVGLWFLSWIGHNEHCVQTYGAS